MFVSVIELDPSRLVDNDGRFGTPGLARIIDNILIQRWHTQPCDCDGWHHRWLGFAELLSLFQTNLTNVRAVTRRLAYGQSTRR